MTKYLTLVYTDKHPKFKDLCCVEFSDGLIACSNYDAIERLEKLESLITQIRMSSDLTTVYGLIDTSGVMK